jgi:hypothetical protein
MSVNYLLPREYNFRKSRLILAIEYASGVIEFQNATIVSYASW